MMQEDFTTVKFYVPAEIAFGGDANGYEFFSYRVQTQTLRIAFETRLGALPKCFQDMMLTDKLLRRPPSSLRLDAQTAILTTPVAARLARALRRHHVPQEA